MRRPVMAIIGSAGTLDEVVERSAQALGTAAVDAGFRIVTGGLTGVMLAASRGAHEAAGYVEGSVIGVIPSYDRQTANPYVDVVVPTGMQVARNVIVVAMADVVVAVSGGAGTLSEIALAWQLEKPVIALAPSGGWATRLAGEQIDARSAAVVTSVDTPQEAVAQALSVMDGRDPGEVGSGWKRGADE